MTWLVIGALCLATVSLKAAGPLGAGGRKPSARALGVTSLLAPALLAGLVVYETFGSPAGPGVVLDARAGGLAAGVVALLMRLPMLAVVLVAAVATALLRLA